MKTQIDEKGKVFTNVVPKVPVEVKIQTIQQLVRGKYHLRPEERLTDELNRSGDFIALTDAEILNSDGDVIDRCEFLTINRGHVVWVYQEENPASREGAE